MSDEPAEVDDRDEVDPKHRGKKEQKPFIETAPADGAAKEELLAGAADPAPLPEVAAPPEPAVPGQPALGDKAVSPLRHLEEQALALLESQDGTIGERKSQLAALLKSIADAYGVKPAVAGGEVPESNRVVRRAQFLPVRNLAQYVAKPMTSDHDFSALKRPS